MRQTDDQWLNDLRKSEVYRGINVDRELGKMKMWLSLRPGRKLTRRFIVNWLNKIDAPIQINQPKINTLHIHGNSESLRPMDAPAPPPKEWRELINKIAKSKEA
jgi:hypothetical protein